MHAFGLILHHLVAFIVGIPHIPRFFAACDLLVDFIYLYCRLVAVHIIGIRFFVEPVCHAARRTQALLRLRQLPQRVVRVFRGYRFCPVLHRLVQPVAYLIILVSRRLGLFAVGYAGFRQPPDGVVGIGSIERFGGIAVSVGIAALGDIVAAVIALRVFFFNRLPLLVGYLCRPPYRIVHIALRQRDALLVLLGIKFQIFAAFR